MQNRTAHSHSEPTRSDERLSLPVEQGVLLWCIRVWVAGLHQDRVQARTDPSCGAANGEAARHRIADMLDRLGTPTAAPFFDGFMFALSHGATRTIGIQCVCQSSVAPDERTLLDAFGLAQESRPFEALLLLRGLATPEAARSALRSAEGFGGAMAQAGRVLPAPDSAVARFALASPPAGATLH